MQQKKTKKTQQPPTTGTTPIAFRLENDLHVRLRPYADKGRRTIAAQLNLVVEEWLDQQVPIAPTTISTAATNQPVPKVFQKGHVAPSAPKNALAEIVEDETGWESGSDPKTFLGGTKVTI